MQNTYNLFNQIYSSFLFVLKSILLTPLISVEVLDATIVQSVILEYLQIQRQRQILGVWVVIQIKNLALIRKV